MPFHLRYDPSISVYICSYMYMYMYILCICICVCICIHTHTHTHVYIYIHIYTYISKYTQCMYIYIDETHGYADGVTVAVGPCGALVASARCGARLRALSHRISAAAVQHTGYSHHAPFADHSVWPRALVCPVCRTARARGEHSAHAQNCSSPRLHPRIAHGPSGAGAARRQQPASAWRGIWCQHAARQWSAVWHANRRPGWESLSVSGGG